MSDPTQQVAEAMEAEYETQMAADNDGSPLPYINWLKLAATAIDALQLTEERGYPLRSLTHGSQLHRRWVSRWEPLG